MWRELCSLFWEFLRNQVMGPIWGVWVCVWRVQRCSVFRCVSFLSIVGKGCQQMAGCGLECPIVILYNSPALSLNSTNRLLPACKCHEVWGCAMMSLFQIIFLKWFNITWPAALTQCTLCTERKHYLTVPSHCSNFCKYLTKIAVIYV